MWRFSGAAINASVSPRTVHELLRSLLASLLLCISYHMRLAYKGKDAPFCLFVCASHKMMLVSRSLLPFNSVPIQKGRHCSKQYHKSKGE